MAKNTHPTTSVDEMGLPRRGPGHLDNRVVGAVVSGPAIYRGPEAWQVYDVLHLLDGHGIQITDEKNAVATLHARGLRMASEVRP